MNIWPKIIYRGQAKFKPQRYHRKLVPIAPRICLIRSKYERAIIFLIRACNKIYVIIQLWGCASGNGQNGRVSACERLALFATQRQRETVDLRVDLDIVVRWTLCARLRACAINWRAVTGFYVIRTLASHRTWKKCRLKDLVGMDDGDVWQTQP